MSFYEKHVFFCTNLREEGAPRPCCGRQCAEDLQAYAKKRVKALGLNLDQRVRVNKAGCFDRCEDGPLMVVYPEAVWYTYIDESDIDEIIDSHLVKNIPVQRLMVK